MDNEKLEQLNEELVGKGYYNVSATTIRYWYKEVFDVALKETCSLCLVEGFISLKKFYRANKDKA